MGGGGVVPAAVLCVLSLLLAHVSMSDVRRSKVVSTLLNAKWARTPFVLEAAEFLAEENDDYFWDLLDFMAEPDNAEWINLPDKEVYGKIMSFSSRYLSEAQLKLMKFALSLRIHSPTIEMFQQVGIDRGVSNLDCDAVIDYGGKLTCHFPGVTSDDEKQEAPQLLKQDHLDPRVEKEAAVAILYAQAGTKNFQKLHKQLRGLAGQGKVRYVFRHYIQKPSSHKLRMSGYGVELQIKSSEYKAQDDRKVMADGENMDYGDADVEKTQAVNGFMFNTLSTEFPEDKEKLQEFKQFLLDENNPMAPLKVWQLQDLSLQAAVRVLNSPPAIQLKVLAELSQNFPSHARPLSKTSVPKDVKKEIKKNRDSFFENLSLQPNDAALFINGLHYDMDYVDIFTIFDTIKSESKILEGLGRLGLTDEQASHMISLDFSGNKQTYGIDIRDSAVNWINDLERDKLYKGWPESVNEMLRPTFPGMMRSVRKNFFNIVILCDPSKAKSRALLKMLESFYVHRAPTRIGIVFTVNSDVQASGQTDAGVALMNAYNYIAANKEPYDALAFITDVYSRIDGDQDEDVTVEMVHKVFKSSYASAKVDDVFEEDSEYDVGRQLAKDFVQRTGFSGSEDLPQVLMNGVPLDTKTLNAEDFEEAVMMSIMRETNTVQKAVYRHQLKDEDDCLDYLMKQPNIMPRLNDRVLKSEEAAIIDLSAEALPKLKWDTFAHQLTKAQMASTLANSLGYLTQKDPDTTAGKGKLYTLSAWTVVDLETQQGRHILRGALAQVKSSSQLRVALIHNSPSPGLISRAVEAAIKSQTNGVAKHFVGKLVKEDTVANLQKGKKKLTDYDIPGADMDAFLQELEKLNADDDKLFEIHRLFSQTLPSFKLGSNGVVLNGKVIGPLNQDEEFGSDDFNLLEKFSMGQYGEKMLNTFYNHMDAKADGASDLAMKLTALLVSRPETKTRTVIPFYGDKHSVVKIDPAMKGQPSFDITAIIDPVSQGAQKISDTLRVLSQVTNAKIRVFLNCVDKHSETPQKSYFRMVLEPELAFNDANGQISPGPQARFNNLPEEPIFTMHYHIPDNWLIEPVKSIYDLDNIKLANVGEGSGVHSEFELEYLLLEGHCFEAYTGNPPRGLQLTLGTKAEPVVVDTIVMANLGYLQLKSRPGRWLLRLRDGRSSELYDIVSVDGTETKGGQDIPVLISSFQSKIVKLRVSKKPDKRNEELLESDSDRDKDAGGLWNSITSTFGGSSAKANGDSDNEEPLNIFCLASGHLYERLLKIMMLSVTRTTKAPVKFWILKSYLSPNLKEFLPYYAAKYGFQYEYVQYKWPRWLNQQREKQRIIWGYKILFLDVMFPLDVKKIIFVDTDQIVRADLTELRDLDLGGAPYGYTPFCDSNTEMEGFRFWKTGYWKNHLAGRKYHISALYVVDLVKFRQIAAGDRLRGQYQALSQDPNSLSNLDQDLPNNMIHQVPIKSLPQEWLWCETWCDKGSLAQAKSIDLCNNPLTKEPKLDAARRIVSEWTDYDEEMQALADDIKSGSVKKQQTGDDDNSKHSQKHSEL